jgi:hypothetical protein
MQEKPLKFEICKEGIQNHSEQIPYKRVVKNIFWSYLDFLWSEMCFLGSREAPLTFKKKFNI